MENQAPTNGQEASIPGAAPGQQRRPDDTVEALSSQAHMLSLNSTVANGQPTTTTWASLAAEKTPAKDSAKNAAAGLSPFAREFVPRFVVKEPAQTYYEPPKPNTSNGDWVAAAAAASFDDFADVEADDYMVLSELKEVIDNISSQPASYDTLILHITEILNNCVDEDEDIVLQCVVNTIVDQAIIDQNFRYNGVRMCVHLIDHLKLGTSKGSFKDILLQRCQREVARRESLARASDRGAYLRGVALYVGDLSTRLSEKELIESLPDLINTLLNHPSTDNVKNTCLLLKLCGPNLDTHYSRFPGQTFQKIMDRIQKLSETSTETSIVNIATSVIELRDRKWQPAPPPAGLFNPYAQGAQGDGIPESAYQQFPHYSGGGGGGGGYGAPMSYDFGPCGDEQDTDVCDAFEEFLKASGQMN